MPTNTDLIKRRHPEWVENELHWRWLLDSFEGGRRYRWASYGTDHRGFPLRNLVRHKREYPAPAEAETDTIGGLVGQGGFRQGGGLVQEPTTGDYYQRLVRTPVPDFVAEAVRRHLSRIFDREVDRQGPRRYLEWLENTDGAGTPVDRWMQDEVAPLLDVLGNLDVLVDRPPVPEGATVRSRADLLALGLDRVEARVILPQDVLWWRHDRERNYTEVLNREWVEAAKGTTEARFRWWGREGWVLYDAQGEELARGEHPFGVVPQVRLFGAHGRRPRAQHVGLPPMEATAERQREFYNRDSELILSDTTQAHPLIQGPEDFAGKESMPIGPGWLLPKKKSSQGGSTTYEGFEVVDFPKGPAESIRANKTDLRHAIDRSNGLAKPAGEAGTGSMVEQSGISKAFDHQVLNDLLSAKADALADAEAQVGRLVVIVASDGQADNSEQAEVEVNYSKQFDLLSLDEITDGLAQFQDLLGRSGRTPTIEAKLLGAIVRELLPGRPESVYAEFDAEIEAAITSRSVERQRGLEARLRAEAGLMPGDNETDTKTEGTEDDTEDDEELN